MLVTMYVTITSTVPHTIAIGSVRFGFTISPPTYVEAVQPSYANRIGIIDSTSASRIGFDEIGPAAATALPAAARLCGSRNAAARRPRIPIILSVVNRDC